MLELVRQIRLPAAAAAQDLEAADPAPGVRSLVAIVAPELADLAVFLELDEPRGLLR